MTDNLPAGIRRESLAFLLDANSDVISVSAVGSSGALWAVDVQFDGKPPVSMLVDNALNPIYLQVIAKISPAQVPSAAEVTGPFAVVAVARLGESFFLRSAFFMDHSNIHALSNSLRGVALAYLALTSASS